MAVGDADNKETGKARSTKRHENATLVPKPGLNPLAVKIKTPCNARGVASVNAKHAVHALLSVNKT